MQTQLLSKMCKLKAEFEIFSNKVNGKRVKTQDCRIKYYTFQFEALDLANVEGVDDFVVLDACNCIRPYLLVMSLDIFTTGIMQNFVWRISFISTCISNWTRFKIDENVLPLLIYVPNFGNNQDTIKIVNLFILKKYAKSQEGLNAWCLWHASSWLARQNGLSH